jgi:dihydroorotate dehydrogenase
MREINSTRPIFVKLAPDLEQGAILELIEAAHLSQLTGIVATNTTLSREGLATQIDEAGGLSGLPLQQKSDACLKFIAENAPNDMVIMGVGGVFTAQDYRRKRKLGADLVQIYTGWIYEGPYSAKAILDTQTTP